jgi:dolichol-phosphate mannosyltransferase
MATASEPVRGATPSPSISVIVTAMNEGRNLRPTVEAIVKSVAARFAAYEILIIEDGSSDDTAEVAAALSTERPHIRVYRNPTNKGLAYSCRRGIGLAVCQYTAWVAGNNLVPPEAFDAIYDRVGEADVVVSYIVEDVRGRSRRLLSRTFTFAVNILFGTRLRYFTGPAVYKTAASQRVHAISHGSMFVVEMLLRLIKSGQSYVQVGIHPLPRTSGASKTFRPRNVAGIGLSLLHLLWDMRVRRRSIDYAQHGIRLQEDEKTSA